MDEEDGTYGRHTFVPDVRTLDSAALERVYEFKLACQPVETRWWVWRARVSTTDKNRFTIRYFATREKAEALKWRAYSLVTPCDFSFEDMIFLAEHGKLDL